MAEKGENKIIAIITICIILITISFIGCLDEGGEDGEKKDGKEKTTKNQPPIIELIYPKNPSSTLHGYHIDVEWNATDPDNDTLEISIMYWDKNEWKIIVENETNDGEYIWYVGLTGMNTTLRIIAYDGEYTAEDRSSTFYIFNFPQDSAKTIELISPNGGENWSGIQNITWELDFIGHSLAEILIYNGTDWLTLVENYNITNFTKTEKGYLCYFPLDTTDFENGNRFLIQINVNTDGYDKLDEYFTIYN